MAASYAIALMTAFACLTAVPNGRVSAATACSVHDDCSTPHSPHALCIPPGLCQPLPPSSKSLELSPFLNKTNQAPLTQAEQLATIHVAVTLLRGVNPNLRLYRTIHGARPLPRLAALARTVAANVLPSSRFHVEMRRIFASCKDLHTLYIPPRLLRAAVAVLPFSVAPFYRESNGSSAAPGPRFIVADVVPGLETDLPPRGAEVVAFDDVPVRQSVLRNGRDGPGANPSAAFARGIDALTLRFLAVQPGPARRAATVTFREEGGLLRKVRVPWRYLAVTNPLLLGRLDPGAVPTAPGPRSGSRCCRPTRPPTARLPSGFSIFHMDLSPELSIGLQASIVKTPSGKFGLLKLFAFQPPTATFLTELRSILGKMPISGLLIDARGNLGGDPGTVRAVTELVTGADVPVVRMSMRATPLLASAVLPTTNISLIEGIYEPMRAALRSARQAGEEFSGGAGNLFDLPRRTVRQPRAYFGPVVTVVDGRTYSGGDMFATLQRDLAASTLVGYGAVATGGGGATANAHSLLRMAAPHAFPQPLPAGIEISTAFARYYRTGPRAGKLVEAFGVEPDVQYWPTRRDVLEGDPDFFEYIASLLRDKLKQRSNETGLNF